MEITATSQWQISTAEPARVAALCRALSCTDITASVLVNRGIETPAQGRRFLDTSLASVAPPFSIRDMDRAVARVTRAILHREKIMIIGDYDVDGITSTTLILDFLGRAGADVTFHIPHRVEEGYDFKTDHVLRRALPRGVDLIITVDCGSTRHDAVETASASGIDVIITDHHTIDDPPPAAAVVNPRRRDCGAGFGHLAGVGVAFVLLICLRKHLRETGFWKNRPEPNLKAYCDLVALGTIADMVPLVAENRIWSKAGMEIIRTCPRIGIEALARASGVRNDGVSTGDIAFRLAPRLNAAGRMAHAELGVELLTTRNPHRAVEIADTLNRLNRRRQETEQRILDQILESLEKTPDLMGDCSLIMAHPAWHIGVLGIVASRLADRFVRPVILIATSNGKGKGSGRSIPGINLYRGLARCAEHLERFGGHPMAAGVTIETEKIDAFRNAFDRAVSAASAPEDYIRRIPIDMELDFRRISDRVIDELEDLHPHGEGNPEPLFLARNVEVVSSKIVGRNHRKMMLRQAGDTDTPPVNAIQFGVDPASLENRFERIAFQLGWNRWNQRKTAQIIIRET